MRLWRAHDSWYNVALTAVRLPVCRPGVPGHGAILRGEIEGVLVMRVRVRLFGEYATLAGRPDWSVEASDDADLRGLFSALDAQAGKAISKSLLFDEQTILPSIAVMVNGSNVLMKDGLRTRLGDGDQVNVMPLLGGGAA